MRESFFQRYLPGRDRIHRHRVLRLFGRALHSPNLWHFNRRSVLRATVIGLFWTFVPMPFQTIPSTACAILLRANLPLTLLLVWLTNPLTFPPILYGFYRFGRVLLHMPPEAREIPWSWHVNNVMEHLSEIWRPLFAAAMLTSIASALVGYLLVSVGWRWRVARRWRRRALTRRGGPGN